MDTKKINRRNFLKMAGLTGVGLAVTACTPAATPTAAPAATTAGQAATPVPAANTAPVPLEMWAPHPFDAQSNIRLTDYVGTNYLPKHPNIQFKFTQIPGDYQQKFTTSAAGGTLPDLFAVDGINMPTYSKRNLTTEIVGIDPTVLNDFYPSARQEMEWNGKVYGSPIETNAQAFKINQDMMDKAGVQMPTTWDELVSIGQQLTLDVKGKKANESGFDPTQLKQSAFETWCCKGEGSTWMILSWIWSAGGDVYDASKKVTIADDPAVEGIQFLSDLIKKHYIWAKAGTMQAGPEGTYYGGLVAWSETGAFDLANLTQSNPPKFKWDVKQVPPMKAGGKFVSGVGGWLESAYKQSKHVPEAIDFLIWMMSDDYQMHSSKYGYAVPGRKSIAEKRLTDVPQLKTFLDCMLVGKARPRSTEYPTITDALQQAFDESIFGDRPAKEALSDAAKKISDALVKEASS